MDNLFPEEKVKKFFQMLHRLNRLCQSRYDGKCEQEVFIRRYFKKGYTVVVEWETETGLEIEDLPKTKKQLRYISAGKPFYYLGYDQEIEVYIYEASQPAVIINKLRLDEDILFSLKGKFITSEEFNFILNLFQISNND